MSFMFGVPKTASGFTLPTTTASTTPSAGAPALGGAGDNKAQPKQTPSLFGQPPNPAGSNAAFTLTPLSSKTPSLSLGQPTSAAPSVNFTLGGGTSIAASTAAPKLSFTATPASSAATPQFNFSSTAPATTSSGFAPILGSSTQAATLPTAVSLPSTSATVTPLKLPTTPSASTAQLPSTTQLSAITTATSSTSTGAAVPSTGLTYTQLEDTINKWSIDLEEQGKFFLNQAKQLNAWDNLLISNGERILSLHDTIERVKTQQKQLDQELDFVLAQQNELDELSLPLEKQLTDIPITDQNRFEMYQMSEVIDSQLKQMSEDLKEIVEHLNESNKSEEDISDPVNQISRILNAHMNSLQWIDQNTAQITSQLEQINKLHEMQKKNHFHL